MTGLDVLSDAVKIGLGAIIALIGGWLARRSDWKRERHKNKRDLLLRLAEEFDAGHQTFTEYFLDALSKKQLGYDVDTSIDMITQGRRAMQSAEAKLIMIGAAPAAEKVRQHLDLVSQSLSTLRADAPVPRTADVAHPLTKSRRDFLSELQNEFEKLRL